MRLRTLSLLLISAVLFGEMHAASAQSTPGQRRGGERSVARVASGTASQRAKPAGRCASIPGGSRKTICLDQRTHPPP